MREERKYIQGNEEGTVQKCALLRMNCRGDERGQQRESWKCAKGGKDEGTAAKNEE